MRVRVMAGRTALCVVAAAAVALPLGGFGCLTRPVGEEKPTTKVNFSSVLPQQNIDKVDILFAIDNSSSMGDKQKILAEAVPRLLTGLLKPLCRDKVNGATIPGGDGGALQTATEDGSSDDNYGCPMGTEPEFKPITDMHIGIVSSSLGGFGSGSCLADPERNNDDRGRLLNRTIDGSSVANAQPGFLAWFPNSKDNQDTQRHPRPEVPVTTLGEVGQDGTLIGDFQKLVVGVGQKGCGFEAQLESVYHFLVQPDPWVSVTPNAYNQAAFDKTTDWQLLAQRASFLRPDSLLAVILLSDEDDSSTDPLAAGGIGWAFENSTFPNSYVSRVPQGAISGMGTTAPRATSACDKGPEGIASAACTSCLSGFAPGAAPDGGAPCTDSNPSCTDRARAIGKDPSCTETYAGGTPGSGVTGYYGPFADSLNVRFFHMKQRFGIDPQYPLKRYIGGFQNTYVPDRAREHLVTPPPAGKPGPSTVGEYSQSPRCTNPLFAGTLPTKEGDETCFLPLGNRTKRSIYFAVVGGVPNQLLPKGSLTADDWRKVLGNDPSNYDLSGISPYMMQSTAPREGIQGPSTTPGDPGSDEVVGREYTTEQDDLEYACTFALPAGQNGCKDNDQCDCTDARFTNRNSPLCASSGNQVRAKAYPTIRQFRVVKGLGDQGIIASLCPKTLEGDKTSDDYGYNPAATAIVDRLKSAINTQCLPRPLTRDPEDEGKVQCLVLAQLYAKDDNCSRHGPGLSDAPPEIADKLRERQAEEKGVIASGSQGAAPLPVCLLEQKPEPPGSTCKEQTTVGWCYEDGVSGDAAVGRCQQNLRITGVLPEAQFVLQCVEVSDTR